jgi:hypothetical protein
MHTDKWTETIETTKRYFPDECLLDTYLFRLGCCQYSDADNRLNNWLTFFNRNRYLQSDSFYRYIIEGVLEIASENRFYWKLTNREVLISQQLFLKLWNTVKPIELSHKSAGVKLYVLSMVYGKYPAMFTDTILEEVFYYEGDLSESVISRVTFSILLKLDTPWFLLRQIDLLSPNELDILMKGLLGSNEFKNSYFQSLVTRKEFNQLMLLEFKKTYFDDNILCRSLIYIKITEETPGLEKEAILFLKSSEVFTNKPKEYLSEIGFWKMAFRLVYPAVIRLSGLAMEDCVGYLEQMKYCENDPLQFSVQGRTSESLSRLIRDWYDRIGANLSWKGSANKTVDFKYKGSSYQVCELTSSGQLLEESKNLSHCVETFDWGCYLGSCQIWSLKIKRKAKFKALFTLEVVSNSIVQVKGMHNIDPDEGEMEVIKFCASLLQFEIKLDQPI